MFPLLIISGILTVANKYSKVDSDSRGGAMYLFLTLCKMFLISKEINVSMVRFIDIFKRGGSATYCGENGLVAAEELLGFCKCLNAVTNF